MPGKYNPFRPDKLATPGMFAGRFDEMRIIDQCLMQTKGGNPQHFLVEGERGIGKSSPLLCGQLVGAGRIPTMDGGKRLSFIVVSISLEERDDEFSIMKKLTLELKNQLLSRNSFKAFGLKAWEFASRFEAAGVKYNKDEEVIDKGEILSRFQFDLVKILSGLDDETAGMLFLIDEANKAPTEAGLGRICKLLTEEMTRKECERLCIGLAGLPNTIDVLRGSHESSPRIFRTMSLKPLETQERLHVITSGIQDAVKQNGFNIEITDDAKSYIAALSEGYPHFLQEFAYCAFEEDSDNKIDRKDVHESLHRENGAFDQLGRKYFNQYYEGHASDDYRTVLHTMAKHGDEWVSRADIIAESGLRDATIDNAFRALKKNNAVTPHDTKPGLYKLPTRSFAAWINAKQGIIQGYEGAGMFPEAK